MAGIRRLLRRAGGVAARRTAGIHTLFNIVGTTIGMILLVPYSNFILWLSAKYGINPMMQVALAHIIFNTATTVVFFPLLKQMCNIIRKIIPGKEPERVEVNVDELENNNLENILPSAAINAAQMTIFKMGDVVMQDGLFITLDSTMRQINPEYGNKENLAV